MNEKVTADQVHPKSQSALKWRLLEWAVRFYVAPWRKGRFILTFDWDRPFFLVTGKTESADVSGHFNEEGLARVETERDRLDEAIRDALDVAVGFVGVPVKDAEAKISRMVVILNNALDFETQST